MKLITPKGSYKNTGIARAAGSMASWAKKKGPGAKWAQKKGPGMKWAQKKGM